NHWLISPGTIHLVFGETITHEETKHLSYRDLKDLVKEKIQAEVKGRITEISVENGHSVERNQVLFKLDKLINNIA
ncbi:biotin/lipoyl-binding protein, partial [candidate division KSB1 bacterium]|nr:biotin/lipoyl-binding protein [candidate division KSB1 bacterium]